MPTRYAYMITRLDTGRRMSSGTLVLIGDDTAKLADSLLTQNRVEHSYYAGSRRCSVWPQPADVPMPDTAPVTAEHYDG
ncbi:hypothetical protein [Streptomyces sp. SCL15-4]|uniref:hypothetical protein n=1 Tax=Streptomyces sp. SCL15-4 TaxID=2967221 RepID=UPI0029661086|nr:hypothetical protein [Streptomyces sp. SCL15-4]